jgi:hypothetical protein
MSISDFALPFGFGRYLSVNGHYGLARVVAFLTSVGLGAVALWLISLRVPQNPAQDIWSTFACLVVGFVAFAWLQAIESEERSAHERRAAECWYRRRNTGVRRDEMDDPDSAFITAYCFSAENARLLEAGLIVNKLMTGSVVPPSLPN